MRGKNDPIETLACIPVNWRLTISSFEYLIAIAYQQISGKPIYRYTVPTITQVIKAVVILHDE
jgi:hypothetical protein